MYDPTGDLSVMGDSHHILAAGRSSDGRLSIWSWASGSGWGSKKVGGNCASAPFLISGHAFAQSSGNTLYHWWDDGSNNWTGKEDLAGQCMAPPVVVDLSSSAFPSIHVFAQSNGNTLYHWWFSNGTWGREDLGGNCVGCPYAITGPNPWDVLTRGTNKHAYHYWYTGLQWMSEDLGMP